MAWKKRSAGEFDQKDQRPRSLAEKLALVQKIYQLNEWHKPEHKASCQMLGMPLKAIIDYSEAELDIFLRDFEVRRMILFAD